MTRQHPDKRVRRTTKDLHGALLHLMESKKFDKITVTDIVREAGYNRGTFYAYYKTKEELLEEMIAEVFEEMTEAYRKPYKNQSEIDLAAMKPESIVLFDHFLEYRKFYKLMLEADGPVNFHGLLTEKLDFLFRTDFDIFYMAIDPEIDAHLFSTYRTTGVIGMVLSWMKDGCRETPAYMSNQLLHVLQFHAPVIRVRRQESPARRKQLK
ncbi:TetR/AcrR family transcriptional regulator [Planococcus lenghuensis]|uniref:TetR family transcriptional regulator n=1 Tax=Planococcus lenghuensis TaxID=2213202 RepID=A0A1Q2KZP4_9BACL|nr:TetR/AcrR family transcriptional regulator [Planococcus lenghuensis]AQQ53112.1 TetR family transcriptional regulator [Planococcus lenghuensis]